MLVCAAILALSYAAPLAVAELVSPAMVEATETINGKCVLAAKTRVHEAKLEPSTKSVALRSAMVPAPRPSWFASAFGDCELAKDGSAIRRRTLQCLDVFTLSRASCPTPKPCAAEACTCDGVELCTENGRPSQIAGCPEGAAESRWPATGKLYEELGCIASVASANTSRYMDFACMQSNSTPCRDGLPFYSWVKGDMTAEACLNFCLGKGFDLFGVLSNLECRCGGSVGNKGTWSHRIPRRQLLFPLNSMRACSGTDALTVYRYTGLFVAGSVPSMALHRSEQDNLYVDSVMAGRRFPPNILGDMVNSNTKPVMGTKFGKSAKASMLQNGQLRACAPSQCGPGKLWPIRIPVPAASPKPWEEIVGIEFHFKPGASQAKKNDFRDAAKVWMSHTCLVFKEKASGSQVAVDTSAGCQIDRSDGSSQPTALGYPGTDSTNVYVGGCGEGLGRMIHEIGHVIGLSHVMNRPDAHHKVNGHGPYLNFNWDKILELGAIEGNGAFPAQFDVIEDDYVGSADDGPGDPYSGWAPYDYNSIMHYPSYEDYYGEGQGLFQPTFLDTDPSTVNIGQRDSLSPADVLQVLDIYQCKRRTQ